MVTGHASVKSGAESTTLPYSCLFDHATDAIFLIDARHRVADANRAACAALGAEAAMIRDLQLTELIGPAGAEEVRRALPRAEGGASVAGMEMELLGRNGARVPVLMTLLPESHAGQRYVWLVARILEAHGPLADRPQLALSVFENSNEGIMVTDDRLRIVAVNRAFTTITGYEEHEVIGSNPRILQSGRQDDTFYAEMWRTIEESSRWQGEIWNRRKSGELYPEWLNISMVRDATGKVTHYVGLFSDISAIKASQERLDHLAHHDPLTDLPNRLLFQARLSQALKRMRRSGSHVALLYIDLDEFKPVNDQFGHEAGDAVLLEVAGRLTGILRDEDTVARLGGDEFGLILEAVRGRDNAVRVARLVDETLHACFWWGGIELEVAASIGIAIAPDDATDAKELVKKADARMYLDKMRRRSGHPQSRAWADVPDAPRTEARRRPTESRHRRRR